MKIAMILTLIFVSLILISLTKSQPDFNGNTPGCGGSDCHTSQSGIVTAEVLSNFQVRITVTGTTSSVAGELVNASGDVVAVENSTGNNPFTLTAPSAGTFTVNAGYKNPSREWGTTSAVITVTGVDEKLIGLSPGAFELYANYPNPFNPSTKIRYAISQTVFTTLKVYSTLGQEVGVLINEEKTPGVYEVNFDGLNLSSGTYIYKLKASDYSMTRKMLLLK
jgi:hypothetical protein